MIPLLSLGIPGDVVTGVILGAFMFHGLTPGPLLFQENLNFVYAIYIGIMVSSLILFGAGVVAIKGFAQITRIPSRILFPAVLVTGPGVKSELPQIVERLLQALNQPVEYGGVSLLVGVSMAFSAMGGTVVNIVELNLALDALRKN